ncbi:unnamed protein product [Owenia fusiformis]|uniref:Uncharacterized protein n=1 Tax=Owenia fusiformis TaxID=6347 RepID=A0A8J1U937_OWEFU|nr:unnamed protein product [Owenia fusiformis]
MALFIRSVSRKCLLTTRPETNIVSCCYNSNRASVTRIHRYLYPRMYPTVLVQSDGSTITVRYKEPRKIIQLPLDLSKLTEAERVARVNRRKPKKKLIIDQEIDTSFDANKYLNLGKSKK